MGTRIGLFITHAFSASATRFWRPPPRAEARQASSIQWEEHRLILKREGETAKELDLEVSKILDVWPGPLPGLFAANTNDGIGIILGQDFIPGGNPFGVASMLRSSRPDIIVGSSLRTINGRTSTVISELYSEHSIDGINALLCFQGRQTRRQLNRGLSEWTLLS